MRATKRAESPPLLVIEVLSPSTRLFDLGSKRLAYREGGVGAYWIAEPIEPSLTLIRWEGDTEHEQVVVGADVAETPWPFPASVIPQALVDD